MKEPIRVLYIAQEFTPFVLENVMAKITSEFPLYLQEQGCEVRIFMPCYGHINERRNQLHEVQRLSGMNLIIDDNDHQLIIKVATLTNMRMQVYFIDNEEYFRRKGTDVDLEGVEFEDNDQRLIFFARGVLETIKKLRWAPDIIHCNGYFSALIPYYIKTAYNEIPFFQTSKIVYSVFGCAKFTKQFPENFASALRINSKEDEAPAELVGNVDWECLTKFAVKYSDAVAYADDAVTDAVRQEVEQLNLPVADLTGEDKKEKYVELIRPYFPAPKQE